jgi:hypothetical protein
MTLRKWGALASFVLVATFITSPLIVVIYLTTPYPSGHIGYQFADFLSGPLWAASLMMVVFALRERIGERAPRRMLIVLLAATLSAALMICVAMFRSVHRDFHFYHPALRIVVSALIAAGRHFLGWALLALASVGWTTRQLPRGLSALWFVSGILSLFAYLLAGYSEQVSNTYDGLAWLLYAIPTIWLGLLLWTAGPRDIQAAAEDPMPA